MTGMSHIETPEFLKERLEEFGTPASYPQYSLGWAHAMDTPYQWTKRVASHFGGTRNGLIVHWPRGIEARNEIRNQFHHVIDVTPTFLEVAGLPQPLIVHGVAQQPIEGVSMAYSFDAPDAPDQHETQYFEVLGNRAIYHKGWTAVTAHTPPVQEGAPGPFAEDTWELYDTNTDWSQARDLASEQPEKLRELQELFLIEAAKYNVLPLDDRAAERANPDLAGRPHIVTGDRQLIYPGVGRLHAFSVISIKNKSHEVTAEVEVPDAPAEGVIVAQGGRVGGWALYAKGGRLKYCYNFYGVDLFHVESTEHLPAGTHQVRMAFEYDGGDVAQGGDVRLYLGDSLVGEGRVGRTQPLPFASDEPLEVGRDEGSAVTPDYSVPVFTGAVNWVLISTPEDGVDEDHRVTSEERLKVALIVE